LEHELYQQWCDESGSDNSLPTVEIGVEANRLQQTPTARAAFNAVHDICTSGQAFVDNWTPADENEIEEQQKRFSKYSQHAISFAIATFSGFVISESSSSANTAVKVVAVAAFFVAIFSDLFSWRMKPKWSTALVYVSSCNLLLLTVLVFISVDKVYAYYILFVPVTIAAAILLQHKLWPGMQQQSTDDASVNQDRLDFMFKLSALTLNWDSNTIITMITTLNKNIPSGLNKYSYIALSTAGLFFTSTIILSIFLMTVATVRTVMLTVHATCLNVLLVIMLLSALIATSITFIYNFDQATEGEVPT